MFSRKRLVQLSLGSRLRAWFRRSDQVDGVLERLGQRDEPPEVARPWAPSESSIDPAGLTAGPSFRAPNRPGVTNPRVTKTPRGLADDDWASRADDDR